MLSANLAEPVFAAHLVDQVVDLQPGWNAVFLEVEPPTNDTLSVFRDVPISSVWTWVRRDEPAEFVQNLSEDLQNDPLWLCFYPTNRYEKMFNDLFRVFANRVYFIKLASASAFEWTVTGRPAAPTVTWSPNEFNLVGFPLGPAGALPTVQGFFATAPSLAGQAVYRLNATGAWQLVSSPGAETMRAGEGMWVYAAGESDHMGPLHVSVEQGDGLDYGASLTELSVYLEDRSGLGGAVSVRDVLSGAAGPLAYWTFDTTTSSVVWQDLPDPLVIDVGTGAVARLRLAVRREDFASDTYETTIEVVGDQGTRVRIPLSASR